MRAAASTRGSTCSIAARAVRRQNGKADTVAATTAPPTLKTSGSPNTCSHARPTGLRAPSVTSR